MALNSKQQLFVKEYLVDKNATRAAKAAGYSAKTAGAQGHDLLKKPEIATAIQKGLEAQVIEAERRAAEVGFTKERWLQELQAIALSNMDDYASVEAIEVGRGLRGKKKYVATVVPKLTKDRPRELGAVVRKISETKNGIGIELHSKISALELLGKAYGWVKTEIELPTGTVNVNLTMPANGREAKPDDGKDQ